jgi:hypothetical protein
MPNRNINVTSNEWKARYFVFKEIFCFKLLTGMELSAVEADAFPKLVLRDILYFIGLNIILLQI